MSSDGTREFKEAWFLVSEIEGERAGSFRQERWCRVFLRAGVRIRIFSIRGMSRLKEVVFENESEFTAFRNEALKAARPVASVREGGAVKLLRKIKHTCLMDFYLPNILGLIARTWKRMGASAEPVIVMASSPPFPLAFVGGFLKTRFPKKVMLFVDMRDAWAMHMALGGAKAVKRAIEQWTLRKADHISTVSLGLKEEFDTTYGTNSQVFYNVATHYFQLEGIPQIDWKMLHPDISRDTQKLVYTGSTPEGFYNLEAIVGGVRRFQAEYPELKGRLQLLFVGACQEVQAEVLRQQSHDGMIVCIPHVSHETAKAIQFHADALVFLAFHGAGNKGVVSTKFFEYLAVGSPILPFTLHVGSDVDRLLQRFCGASLNLLDEEAIARTLAQVAQDGPRCLPAMKNKEGLMDLFAEYQAFAGRLTGR